MRTSNTYKKKKERPHFTPINFSFYFLNEELKTYHRLSILCVVCEVTFVQTEGQAIFSEVSPHALAALGHHPGHPGGFQEVHLEMRQWIRGQGAPSRLHDLTAG